MSELLEAISEKLGTSRKAAYKRYREILETGTASDAEELMELAAKLGKTDISVRADMQTLNNWKFMDNRAGELSARKTRYAGADVRAAKFLTETREILKNREAEQLRLNQEASELEMAQRGSGKVWEQMTELRNKHPELLAD
jgi:biotin operon repressor